MRRRVAVVVGTIALAVLTGAMPAGSQEPEPCAQRLPAERTTLELRNAEITTVLRLMAERYRVSLVVTPDVAGTITVSLFDLPVREAFVALVNSSGLGCVVRDGALVVTTRERLRKEEEARLAAEEAARERARKANEARLKEEQARLQADAEARKKAIGPFKRELWGLSEDIRTAIAADLERTFAFLFEQLSVNGTADHINRFVQAPLQHHAALKPVARRRADVVRLPARHR